jgi:hypothetical protein
MYFGAIKKAHLRFAPRGYAVKTALSRLWLSHPASSFGKFGMTHVLLPITPNVYGIFGRNSLRPYVFLCVLRAFVVRF